VRSILVEVNSWNNTPSMVAAHLSDKNNRPQLAQAALARVLDCETDWIAVAEQETGLDWRSIS